MGKCNDGRDKRRTVDDYIIARRIDEGRVEAEASLRDSGVPVWAIVGHYLYAVDHDAEAVARDYDIPLDDVVAALIFYRRHCQAIDARIAENQDRSVA